MQDDFLRQFLVRFVFCTHLLRRHVAFKEAHHFPSIYPSLPSTLEKGVLPEVLSALQELVGVVNVGEKYSFEIEEAKVEA